MLYLLDTNAWLRWFHQPHELSTSVRQLLNAQQSVGLSPMSIVEVAQKHHKGRLHLNLPLDVWVTASMPQGRVKLLPITTAVALRAYTWPDDFHGDPADRLIAATAAVYGLTLVTSDDKLLTRADLKTLSTR
ncbi:type II toxin-antitoxin system VapC family toxin [Prosthecobacter sp.]|uniref:type II toxin-antitoxin system VapC family toxin n=1 Tax=Prosthecobacter sp. TaxID=1965333 RepID=UPI0037830EE3